MKLNAGVVNGKIVFTLTEVDSSTNEYYVHYIIPTSLMDLIRWVYQHTGYSVPYIVNYMYLPLCPIVYRGPDAHKPIPVA